MVRSLPERTFQLRPNETALRLQLDCGARAFDLRVKVEGQELIFDHGPVDVHHSVREALREVGFLGSRDKKNDPNSGLASFKDTANFSGPVLGYIEAGYCKQILFLQDFSKIHATSSTFAPFQTKMQYKK